MTDTLNWEKSKSTGYASLDLTLTLGANIGTFAIKRQRREEPDAEKWIAWHNDVRISDLTHERRAECQAECERLIYSLPQFKMSPAGISVQQTVEQGAQAYRDRRAIDQNPYNPAQGAKRDHWFTGWLQAYGASAASKAINAAVATSRANEQLENDLRIVSGYRTVYKLAIQYSLSDQFSELADNGRSARHFLSMFLDSTEDGSAIIKAYPEWPVYVSNETGAQIGITATPTKQ